MSALPTLEVPLLVATASTFPKATTLFIKAEKLRLAKQHDRAIQVFRAALDENEDFHECNERLGEIYHVKGETPKAIEHFALAAAGLIQDRKFVTAAAVYMKILSLDPDQVKDESKRIKELLSDLPHVDARVLNNSLICDLVPRPAFFESLSEKEFATVMRSLTPIELSAGEELFSEGDVGDKSIYMIYSGRMNVVTKKSDGSEMVVATLGTGEFFGEFSFLTDAPRSATMRAAEESCVFEMNRERTRSLLQSHSGVGEALQRYYKRRVLDLTLAKAAIFADLDPEERQLFVDCFNPRVVSEGEVLASAESGFGRLYLLKTGSLVIQRGKNAPGDEAQKIVPGEIFGILEQHGDASLTIRAEKESEVMQIESDDLEALLDQVPSVKRKLEETQAANKSVMFQLTPEQAAIVENK